MQLFKIQSNINTNHSKYNIIIFHILCFCSKYIPRPSLIQEKNVAKPLQFCESTFLGKDINGQPSGTTSPSDQTFVYVNQTCDSLYFAIKQKDRKMLERVIDMMQISTEQLNEIMPALLEGNYKQINMSLNP